MMYVSEDGMLLVVAAALVFVALLIWLERGGGS